MKTARIMMAGVAALAAAAGLLAGAGPAAAQPAVLYAAVTATGTGNCADAADACTLSTALGQVAPGGAIDLVTPGGDTAASRYVGNWLVGTPGTSAGQPVTIEAAPGLASQPVMDGDGPNAPSGETCSTTTCAGPVLIVRAGEYVDLSGITIADGDNTRSDSGGGLDNAGTVTITRCTFTGNSAGDGNFPGHGGAIDSGDGFYGLATGTVTVTASTFTGNTATDGGAIDSGDHGGGSVTVTGSTFSGNAATDGGAIDSGDHGGGSVTVTASTFSGNGATDGGAIDSGEGANGGSVTVAGSTFSGNTAVEEGGAIDGGNQGGGSVAVTGSTFSGNRASLGGAIDSGGGTVAVTASTLSGNTAATDGAIKGGAGTVQVAGDVFDGNCARGGMWSDGGYNAGSNASCFNSGPGDVNAGSSSALDLGPLASNGGPTKTIMPGPGSPVTAIIPDPTTVTLGGSQVALCPATDQRGYPSAAGTACDTGAVQTSGSPPAQLYAAVTAAGSGDCSAAADACTLSTALGELGAGGVIELVTPGGNSAASRYVGNWTVGTPGTSARAPVRIEAAPGLTSQPVLDGDGPGAPAGETCSTSSCAGPVLTVPGGEYVALSGITIADGNNTSTGLGGGLDNAGTVTITGSTFSGNTAAGHGGAIDSGDGFNGGPGTGSVQVTASTFTGNTAALGGAIDSGDGGGGTVTVTASTFTGNTATDGGAIDSGDGGGGTVTVTACVFTGNTAGHGGAIDSGEHGGRGTVTVTTSTFTGNTASTDGGAIDSGDGFIGGRSAGSVQVTASTFTGNTATDGGAIDSGDFGGAGTVTVAGDVFDGSCSQRGGVWSDGGYNAGSDASCFSPSPATGDVNAGSSSNLKLGPLASNGGPTKTIAPQPGSPVIALIPDPTGVTLAGSQVALCPATDQRGYPSAAGTGCDAGAVQTSGSPPALTLKISATPGSFNQAGQVITYHYKVTNTGAGTLSGITVTDPAVPGVSCPAASLPPGSSETCTRSYTTTSADLAAGKITDTATASAATTGGVPVASSTATLAVPEGWPPAVSGTHQPAPGAAEGYYLGVTGSTWSLTVTHPGTGKVTFTGTITLNAGAFANLTRVNLGTTDTATVTHKTLTFHITDTGTVKGIRFATTSPATSITFTLSIGGHPATASQLYLGGTPTHPGSGSPLTFTR